MRWGRKGTSGMEKRGFGHNVSANAILDSFGCVSLFRCSCDGGGKWCCCQELSVVVEPLVHLESPALKPPDPPGLPEAVTLLSDTVQRLEQHLGEELPPLVPPSLPPLCSPLYFSVSTPLFSFLSLSLSTCVLCAFWVACALVLGCLLPGILHAKELPFYYCFDGCVYRGPFL